MQHSDLWTCLITPLKRTDLKEQSGSQGSFTHEPMTYFGAEKYVYWLCNPIAQTTEHGTGNGEVVGFWFPENALTCNIRHFRSNLMPNA